MANQQKEQQPGSGSSTQPAPQQEALDALEAARKYGAESWDDWLTNKVDAAIESARAAQEGK